MGVKEKIQQLDLKGVVVLTLVTLVLLQVLSFFVTQIAAVIGRDVKQLTLGPGLLLVITAAGVWVAFELSRKAGVVGGFSKPSLLAIVLIAALVVVSYVYLPQVIPQIFEQSVQSIVAVVKP